MRGHLHHSYADSGERLHYIATAQESADAWLQGAQGATTKWANNLQRTQKPIVDRAVAQKGVMTNNFADAVNSGRWEAALRAVGDAGIKAAAQAKQANFGAGVSQAKDKYQAKIGPLLAYIGAGLPTLEAMPSGSTAAGVARATYWINYMAGAKGL